MEPREGAYLLLADIEEAETGDSGRVRQLLAKALRSPRDPAWTADGYVSERWAPISPVTGKLDAFEWRVPVERLGQLIEQEQPGDDRRDTVRGALPPLPAPTEETVAPQPSVAEAIILPEEAAATTVTPEVPTPPITAPPPPLVRTEPPANDDGRGRKPAVGPDPEHAGEKFPAEPARTARRDEPRLIQTPQPDDPGVDADDDLPEHEARRFRLF
jgi:HemY protein